ncbi:divergent PAP2 family protein [Eubacterium sp. TM05-53]|jgi:acid phosphatase family membrane protein YuiD|uniref:divergent PAP2 family protein n=1 Tax=uncultured Holdemanella sp. TaxID=1763549 RepID=UPI000E420E91|nr:divergent PAP2 family protein [uncultured Holdemanella sp.]RGJ72905.1 divergent PAP2 family protein [Eubacterium sp. TM05-53]
MIPSSLYPLVTALLSNILAQVLKTVVYYYRTGKWDFHWVLASGGFPSSHSSTVTALSLSIGIQEGFDSAIFAVTTIFSFIVMYDACHVRYYSGKNIELTQQLVKDLREMTGLHFDDPIYQEKLKNVLGHKFVEVIGGFVVGLAVPLILCPLFL